MDDHNTDNSEQIIRKHLGHIPGQIVIVKFDGMGPTWSLLVKRGLEAYPNITHGILSDADFMPMSDKLDKMELDIRCSKHMYTIWTRTFVRCCAATDRLICLHLMLDLIFWW